MSSAHRFRRFDLGNKAIEGIFDSSVLGGAGERVSGSLAASAMRSTSETRVPLSFSRVFAHGLHPARSKNVSALQQSPACCYIGV